MGNWSAVAFFCEDLREEKSGQDTLIGVLPDNLRVPSVPGTMPKLAVYARIHLGLEADIRTVDARLELPDGQTLNMGELTDVLARGRKDAVANDLPYVGLVSKALFAPLPIASAGKVKVIVTLDGEDHVCGIMNIIVASETAGAV